MQPTPEEITVLQKKVFNFYASSGRDLPWRTTTDPYHILVSEIMLQQTQVDRVIPRYTKWIRTWPTIQDLSRASQRDVIQAWMGLGYNNRARRLHQTAKSITTTYKGDVLLALRETKLPGIGSYTQRAVRIFATNDDLIAIDTNIRRILIHECNLPETISDKELERIAWLCLPRGKSRDWHNALMDYGAMLLTSRTTGITPKTKQSRFAGSRRQLRAMVLRAVLEQGSLTKQELFEKVSSHPASKHIDDILASLLKDEVLELNGKRYTIKEYPTKSSLSQERVMVKQPPFVSSSG